MANKIKLLTIDDELSICRILSNYFERHNYKVFIAENGEDGLKIFRDKKPDIILVDLVMPGIDGFRVVEAIKQESPDTPVIVVSGEGNIGDVIHALRLGAWDYQTKPVTNMFLFQRTIEQTLEKAKLITENREYQQGLEQRLSAIIENFNGFIFTCDMECNITYMNPSFIKYIGHDATGEKCSDSLVNLEGTMPCCRDKTNVSISDIQNKKDGRWYHVIQSPITGNNGKVKECQVILYDITDRKRELLDLQEQEEFLRRENLRLRVSLADRYKLGSIIGKSKPMQEVYEHIINASASDAGVIIYGESGTGKELVAREIHENSDRKKKRLVYVNCGAIPENLIESEFFGYRKGAFTGAAKDKHGFLDIAEGGTLFLDEIGEIPLNMQVKLLRAIEGRGYMPVGSTEIKKTDIRIIAATNRDLKELVRNGAMRQDFFYRIQIIPVHIPALRERKEDILLLVDHFLKQYDDKVIPPITPRIREAMLNYDWPGNVRELQNTIHRFITLKKLDFIEIEPMDQEFGEEMPDYDPDDEKFSLNESMELYEKKLLEKALNAFSWHKTRVAEILRIDRKTLFNKMKKYNLIQ